MHGAIVDSIQHKVYNELIHTEHKTHVRRICRMCGHSIVHRVFQYPLQFFSPRDNQMRLHRCTPDVSHLQKTTYDLGPEFMSVKAAILEVKMRELGPHGMSMHISEADTADRAIYTKIPDNEFILDMSFS